MRRTSVWVARAWNRLPGEMMESLSLETLRIHEDTILSSVLEGICWSRGAGPADLQWSLPTLTPLWISLSLLVPPKQAVPLHQLLSSGLWERLSRAGDSLLTLLGIPECSRLAGHAGAWWWPCHISHHPPGNSGEFSWMFLWDSWTCAGLFLSSSAPGWHGESSTLTHGCAGEQEEWESQKMHS